MRFKPHVEWEKGQRAIDIAPLIDVVFQLLIFFMLTSSFIFQPGIKIKLPKAVTSEVIREEALVVVITADNQIFLKKKPVTLQQLKSKLKLQRKDRPLLIKADKKASLGTVVDVWDICREVNINQINIATTQE